MRKILLIICAALLISGCGDKNIDDISYEKMYVVGIDAEYAPMGFRNESGEIVGFDIDLANRGG